MKRMINRQKYGNKASRRGVRKSKAERRILLMSLIPQQLTLNITGMDNSIMRKQKPMAYPLSL